MPMDMTMEAPPLVIGADGVVRVGNTRVTLDVVVEAFHEGLRAEAIVQQYPSLELADVYSVTGYYLHHKAKVDDYLHEREKLASQVRQENEKRFNPIGVRDRLLERRSSKG